MIPLAGPRPDEEPNLHLRPERLSLPEIPASVEAQTPDQLRLSRLVLGQILEDLIQGRSGLRAPGCDAAVGIGERGEGRGGTEGFEEREGDGEVAGRLAGGCVEDVACYGIFFGGIGGEERLHLYELS